MARAARAKPRKFALPGERDRQAWRGLDGALLRPMPESFDIDNH
jgi:hypothetical protein